MADETPDNDPLGNRLRATFAAEHADIERRHQAQGAAPVPTRSLKWIPFAVAAAAITIAGFVFIGSRSSDEAVELDVAAQTVAAQTPDNEQADSQAPAGGEPVPLDGSGQPIPTPSIPMPSEPGVMVPYQTGVNMCGDSYRPDANVVDVNEGGSVPAMAEPEASGEIGVTRMLVDGTAVELAGGCTSAVTSMGTFQWFEIMGAPGEPAEWIRSDYIADPAQPDPIVPAANMCDVPAPIAPHFVWDVLVTDLDGGLVAHTAPGVNQPATRTIRFDEVVAPTGGCVRVPNGARWYELGGPALSTDWVNAQYLQLAAPACLRGEQFGTRARNGQLIHVVAQGDRLGSIAARYNVAVEELLAANPQLNPNLIIQDEPIWIPGVLAGPSPIVGPLDGWAVIDGDSVAFTRDSATYRWYLVEGVDVGTQCFPTAAPGDTLEERGCFRVAAPVTSSTTNPLEYLPWPAGDASSTADHVHDIRTESNEKCTRIVITFGDNANEEDSDAASTVLPSIAVNQGLNFVHITANGWTMESAFMDTDRVDYDGGIAMLTVAPGFQFAVELIHRDMEPNVSFLDNPARVVVDLFPIESSDATANGPFGERFVLRGPIQQDLFGPGIPVENNIIVEGFGRPFEAAGLYRIWSVPDDVDANTLLADPPEPLIEEFFATRGSAEGWGSFFIDLPDLEPGTYIAVFGELPPTDEIGFYGTGQLFRVTDSPTEDPGNWPEAVLLPDVQLPPESFD